MNSLRVSSFWTCLLLVGIAGRTFGGARRPVLSTRVQCQCQRMVAAAVHFPVTNGRTKSFVAICNKTKKGPLPGALGKRAGRELDYRSAADDEAVDEQQDHRPDDRADPARRLLATA